MINFNDLTPAMKEVITQKAEECDVDVSEYISCTDKNYCIVSEEDDKIITWANGGEYDYVVYGDIEDAKQDILLHQYIITEEEAVMRLNKIDKEKTTIKK